MCEWLSVMVFHCVRLYVTVCDCVSGRKWEVCGVEMALMELDVVHNRQDFTSDRGLEKRERDGEKKGEETSNNMTEGVKHYHKP